jgi:hypothetical protein
LCGDFAFTNTALAPFLKIESMVAEFHDIVKMKYGMNG